MVETSQDSSPEDRSPVEAIADRVRALRSSRGWSMRELARRAGVSQPFVSKLEGGQILPSVPTLYTLAQAFDTTPSALLPSLQTSDGEHLRVPLAEEATSNPVEIVAGGDGAGLQIYEFTVGPEEGHNGFFEHGGEEVLYVVSGTVYALTRESTGQQVDTGGSLRIDPKRPHSWRAGSEGAHFLLITSDHPTD